MAKSSDSSSEEDKKKKKKKKEKKESKKGKERKEERKRARSDSSEGGKKKKSKKDKAKKEESPEPANLGPTRADMAPSGLLEAAGRSRSRDDGPSGQPPVILKPLEQLAESLGVMEDDGKAMGKGKSKDGKGAVEQPKEQPNFEASGLLGMEDNSKNGVALNFTMPPEARRPTLKWRLYVYTKQQGEEPKVIQVHRQAGYLFGKDRRVADIPTDHQTCSKQHAVLHFRMSPKGDVRPYLMDLESKNGSFLNGKKMDPARYHELREGDALKFAMSSREYVLLHTGSANHIKIDEKLLRSDSE